MKDQEPNQAEVKRCPGKKEKSTSHTVTQVATHVANKTCWRDPLTSAAESLEESHASQEENRVTGKQREWESRSTCRETAETARKNDPNVRKLMSHKLLSSSEQQAPTDDDKFTFGPSCQPLICGAAANVILGARQSLA